MSEQTQQVRNALIYMVPMGVKLIVPLVTIPLLTRRIGPEEYGVLSLAMVFAIFMGGFSSVGIPVALERNYFLYTDDSQRLGALLASCLSFMLFNFFAIFIITYLYIDEISRLLTGSKFNGPIILTALAANFFYNTIVSLFYIYFKNGNEAKSFSVFTSITAIINLFLTLYYVLYYDLGAFGIALSQLVTGIIIFISLVVYYSNMYHFSLSKEVLVSSLKVGYPLTPRIVLNIINSHFDKYILGLLNTVDGVGIYHIGKRIAEIGFNITTSIQNVYNPYIYRKMFANQIDNREVIGVYLTPIIFTSILVQMIIALFSEEIIALLTPPNFHTAAPIVSIISMYYGFSILSKVAGTQFVFMKKLYITLILSVISMIVNIGLNIPLILNYGLNGAAMGTLIEGIVSGILSVMLAQRIYRIGYEYKKVAIIFIIFYVSSTIIAMLIIFDYPYSYKFCLKTLSLILYFAYGYKINIISWANIQLVKSSIWAK